MLKKLLAVIAFLFFAATAFAANVDVNTASAADLDGIKGIGPALSGRILEARQQGQFKDWSDLITRVKGIGGKNAAKFSAEGLTVGGAAYQGAPAAESKATKASHASKTAAAATVASGSDAAAPAPAADASAAKKHGGRKGKKADQPAAAASAAP